MRCKDFVRLAGFSALAVFSACMPFDREDPAIGFSFEPQGAIRFKNAAVELVFDSLMYCAVYHLKDGRRLSLTGTGGNRQGAVPSHFIVAGGKEVRDFKVDYSALECSEVISAFGPGRRLVLKGVSTGPGEIKIEKSLTVELYDNYPDAAVTSARYRNLSEGPLELGDIYSSTFLLCASLADPALVPNQLHAFYGNAGRLTPQIDTELPVDYAAENYTGRTVEVEGQKRGNGGIPFIDLWCEKTGLAVGHLETAWRNLYLPIRVSEDGRVFAGVREDPSVNLPEPAMLASGETVKSVRSFICVHGGDFYAPAAVYAGLMRCQGMDFSTEPSENDYLAAWCSWNSYCTLAPASKKDVMVTSRVLERVEDQIRLGIRMIIFDAGWFDNQGDWKPNPDPLSFPGGEAELAGVIEKIHARGGKVMLWISLLTADPWSEVAKQHPDWMILKPGGEFHLDRWSGYTMCPSLPQVQEYHSRLAARLIGEYGADAFKIDGMYTCPACYNPAHGHENPNESSEDFYKVFRAFYEQARRLKPEATVMLCPCGTICAFNTLPYVSQTIAADPPDLRTVRRWAKLYRALKGPGSPYSSDYVHAASGKMRLPTAVGVGAVPQSFQGEPPQPEIGQWYSKWFAVYQREMLSTASYENLYDMYYDKPETHAFSKEASGEKVLYYSMFADDSSWSGKVELRGLEAGRQYRVVDYAADSTLGTVTADRPLIEVSFEDYLLVKCIPL